MVQSKSSESSALQISSPEELKALYDKDFAVWIDIMVQLLKEGKLENLDLENLIEEVESLGRSDKRELKSNLRILLMHLLKWQYQPERRALGWSQNEWNENSWARSIIEHRSRIQDLLVDSPSLRNTLSENLMACYEKARFSAAKETGLDIKSFPLSCEYTESDILNDDFWPE